MDYQKHLLRDRRFWPSFWTQYFGAFNDNVFKNALVMLITYKSYRLGALTPESMVALCGGIFILPFFLFSALAGQICDKYPKHQLIFYIKIWEILVMLVGAYGFIAQQVEVLIGTLFVMGLQSTFFGPVKYSILPELINDNELVHGNALFSMGTFVSILLGMILGGTLIADKASGDLYVAISVVLFAIIGALFSLKIHSLKANAPELKIEYGLFKPTWHIIKITKQTKSVFLAVMGISWFWFLGAALLSMFPPYVKNLIGGSEYVATLFLALFSIGVAVGSILCSKLSRERLELGLVPFGTFGMSLFILDLFLVGNPVPMAPDNNGILPFLNNPAYYRIIFDVFAFSAFSGLYTVPLMTFIQQRSAEGERSRIIAGLNVLNALFMVGSAVILTIFYQVLHLSMPQIFGIWALINFLVSLYIYTVLPEFLLRFVAVIVTRIMYRLKLVGGEHIPDTGGCILTCNHVSFADWLIIYAGIKRPVRFIMYYKYMQIPLVRFLFRDAKVIPIAGQNEDPEILAKAMDAIEQALNAGDIICIFPEGEITNNGDMKRFRSGIEFILKRVAVPVLPMTLDGLWGSFFSRKYKGKALSNPLVVFHKWRRRVELKVYEPWNPQQVSAEKLERFTRDRLSQ